MSHDGFLANLNPSQHAAVSSFADQLAILAGPGSGKTHTLTSRTAWLLAQGLQPWNIIVATFTVKAAREMKERIGKLIGNGMESKLILGTFHSIARRYLVRYGHLVGLEKDFGIADSSDSLAILKRIVKRNKYLMDEKVARSRISGLKARMSGYEDATDGCKKSAKKSVEEQEFEAIFAQYEEALQRSNLLDYDDLLLRCAELLRKYPSCVSNVEAVLIDEFQDTNIIQFDLMRLFAAHRKRITIVGDPDQSIYGFRAAEVKNYKRMLHQYPDTVTIALEENYRSSGAILLSALSVIEQDASRVAKSLLATHTVGTRPVLRKLANAHKEAEWIISEIQRVKGLTGDLLDLNDFAILLRSAALSRLIESELGKAGIAYRMVGGLRFYDRVEVKTILDYLRVINQPDNNDALARIINTPSRRIGEATIKSLLEEADEAKITLWALIIGVVQGKRRVKTRLPAQTDQGLNRFVNIILTAKNKISGPKKELKSISDLIKFVVNKTDYESWLEDHHGDFTKARWANVEELITQAKDFQEMVSVGYDDDALPQIDELEQNESEDWLARFLANVALASEVNTNDAEGSPTAQVTISTIHAAKGLEWPVVFIPATYEGSIPHSRSEDTNEERRIFYVAMTRAKSLLYMTCPLKNSRSEETTLSPFLSPAPLAPLLDQQGPSLRAATIQTIALILRRVVPSKESISKSSAFLRSSEDNLFPLGGEEDKDDTESRWNGKTGNPTFTMGQQGPKRRRIELGRSISNPGDVKPWQPTYATTMERAASFTAATVGFVSAGSHMQVLKEQSLSCVAEVESGIGDKEIPKKKVLKQKHPEGQGTLLGFLGKPEHAPPKHLIASAQDCVDSRPGRPGHPKALAPANNINSIRNPQPRGEHIGIAPALASHRLGANSRIKPRQKDDVEQNIRNDYVFLSSSPPRPEAVERVVERPPPPSSIAKPPLMPLLRPPLSTHETTMSKLQSGTAKTYGLKRSMDGWKNTGGKTFKPPIRRS